MSCSSRAHVERCYLFYASFLLWSKQDKKKADRYEPNPNKSDIDRLNNIYLRTSLALF